MAKGHKPASCNCFICREMRGEMKGIPVEGKGHKPATCKCFICKRRRGEKVGINKSHGGSKEGASLRLVRQSQLPPSKKGGLMGSVNGVDGRINNNLDTVQLQKLIGELNEKILKEIAQSRFHYESAINADKKKERCEERLAELGFRPKRVG